VHEDTNESGQTSIEFALVLALVAIVLAGSVVALNAPFASYVGKIAALLS
jgi:Flp pilus assembly pilin Flp